MEIVHDLSFIVPIGIAAFFAIVFLQSGLDKIVDWKGNKEWLSSHFKSTFLSSMVPFLIAVVAFFELFAGVLAVVGGVYFLVNGSTFWIEQSVIVSILSLLMLLFGQRIAKDYDGAKTIAIYFGIALLSAIFLNHS